MVWWSNVCISLLLMQVWMWRTILFAMLCIVSWSQGLVMAKDSCEATIIKRLAWLVEHLIVSCHESSSFFILFSNLFFNIKIPFLFHVVFISCFFYFFFSFILFLKLFSKTSSYFILFYLISIFLFSSTDSQPLLICFSHRHFYRLFTYHFWIFFLFFFSHSLNKEEIVNNRREHELLILLSPLVPVDSTRWANVIMDVSREQ